MPPLTVLQAIRARCIDCAPGEQQAGKCEIADCPLWSYRFGKRPSTARKRGKDAPAATKTPLRALRAHCIWCSGDNTQEPAKCPDDACALWPYRFGVSLAKAKAKGKAISRQDYDAPTPVITQVRRVLRREGTLAYIADAPVATPPGNPLENPGGASKETAFEGRLGL